MKLTTKNIYQKIFTEIPEIQFHRTIYYNLIECNDGTFGIEVLENSKNGKAKCEMESLSRSKDDVHNLITFLYENSIQAKSCESIIFDIIESTQKFSYKIL